MNSPRHWRCVRRQNGAALLALMAIALMLLLAWFVGRWNESSARHFRQQRTSETLALAKEVLLGRIMQDGDASAGYLPLPDLGLGSEGVASTNFSGNLSGRHVVGRYPWRTLGTGPLRDAANECLWYIVSGRFKNQPWPSGNSPPPHSPLNWDTASPFRLRLVDGQGNILQDDVAALLVAPGAPLAGQDRAASPAASICGGNYDARNYLDPYDASKAVAGAIHYFAGNNHRLTDEEARNFWRGENDSYNDRLLAIGADEVYDALLQAHLPSLLADPHFTDVAIAGAKGTQAVACESLHSALAKTLCHNWKEMLLLTAIDPPQPIILDGQPTPPCSRVLIFGGKRAAGQQRDTAAAKNDPQNYLEGSNSASFATPTALAANFVGRSRFDRRNPSADVLRCIP